MNRLQLSMITAVVCWLCPIAGVTQDVGRKVDLAAQTDALSPPAETAQRLRTNYRLPDLPPQPAESAGLQSVVLRQVEVQGVTQLSPQSIRAVTDEYVNTPITIEHIQEMRLKLSALYVTQGYINSGMTVPAQDLADGVLVIQATEGRLARIEVQDNPRLADRYLSKRVERFVETPLNVGDLQNALSWLQTDDHIGRVMATLTPGEAPGESVLQLAVAEPSRFEATLEADNHRASSVGANRARVGFTARNLSGYGDTTTLGGSLSEGSDDAYFAFDMPLNRYNTSVQLYYSRSDSEVIEDAFDELDIESQTDTAGVSLSHPVLDRQRTRLTVSVGFEEKHSETELAGIPFSFSPGAVDGETDTSAAYLGLDFIRRTSTQVFAMRGTYRRGLDVGDATIFDPATPQEALSNPTGADGEFTSYLLQGLYLRRLNQLPGLGRVGDAGQLVIRSMAQLADDPLMSLEKVAIGGVNTVRGFPENLLVRDNGVSASIEVQVPIPGYRSEPHPLNLMTALFVDYGRSWDEVNTDPTSTVRDTSDKRHVMSAGLGFIWQPLAGLRSEVYWGESINDNFSEDDPRDSSTRERDLQDDGVHVSVSYTVAF